LRKKRVIRWTDQKQGLGGQDGTGQPLAAQASDGDERSVEIPAPHVIGEGLGATFCWARSDLHLRSLAVISSKKPSHVDDGQGLHQAETECSSHTILCLHDSRPGR
jgi:hypothetical protein